jgi:hypothetical protein
MKCCEFKLIQETHVQQNKMQYGLYTTHNPLEENETTIQNFIEVGKLAVRNCSKAIQWRFSKTKHIVEASNMFKWPLINATCIVLYKLRCAKGNMCLAPQIPYSWIPPKKPQDNLLPCQRKYIEQMEMVLA